MLKDPNSQKLISLMAEQEERIGLLYHEYSSLFQDRDFWSNLSKEEFIHQTWILALANSQEEISISREDITIEALKNMIEYLKKTQSETEGLTLLNALSTSVDIERSLLEKDFFKVFQSDSASVAHIMQDLEKATKEHLKRVEEELGKAKMSS